MEVFQLDILRKLFQTFEKLGLAKEADLCEIDRRIILKEFYDENEKMMVSDILNKIKKNT